jgi:hypothetical protein
MRASGFAKTGVMSLNCMPGFGKSGMVRMRCSNRFWLIRVIVRFGRAILTINCAQHLPIFGIWQRIFQEMTGAALKKNAHCGLLYKKKVLLLI